MPDQRLRVTYRLTCAPGEDPVAKARDIAFEQTVELPPGLVAAEIAAQVAGDVETVEPAGDSRWRAVVSYDPVLVDDLPQLLNILFGNISMKAGIQISAVDWPASLLVRLGGPGHGITGIRAICGVSERRPLVCAALKPLGLSSARLSELCHQLALGGIDIIKDDHSLTDQAPARFRERVERCQEAVTRANAGTGGASAYFPNVTSGVTELGERVAFARQVGCRGVLVSPLPLGLDAVRSLARASGPAIVAHPSLAGAFFHADSGVAPEVLLGDVFRLAGSDAVVYPNAGGRFTFSEATCQAINTNLRRPLGAIRPALPVPGGGIDVARVPHWIGRYGVDTMFLIGGSLYAQTDLAQAARHVLEAVRRQCDA